jgi:hypothetical protein
MYPTMNLNAPDIVAIVGLMVTLPPSFVALQALVRRQGVVREDPGQSIRAKPAVSTGPFSDVFRVLRCP